MIRLGLRTRLLVAVLAALTGSLGAAVFGFNQLLAHNLAQSADSLARARASAELGLLRPAHGKLRLAEAPYEATPDANIWVLSGSQVLEGPRAGKPVEQVVRRLAARAPGFATVAGIRLFALPVIVHGKLYGSVTAGVPRAPYDETRETALLASLAFAAGLLLVVGLAAWWLLHASLRPVRALTRQAAAWSEQDLDHRFDFGEPHDELTELAATLDRLLDRLAASLRREQRFSAELSHELRTPLTRILVESDLSLRRERGGHEYRETLELVRGNAQQLSRIVDSLVAAARHVTAGHRGTADAHAVVAGAAAACRAVALERDVEVYVVPPARPIRIGVDPDLAERILQPVIENACRYTKSRVELAVRRDHGAVVFTVSDDGVGVHAAEADPIFEPGTRGAAGQAQNGAGGAGLGLALARRLARGVKGEVAVVPGSDGGRFLVQLPAA